MEFSSDEGTQQIRALLDALIQHVLLPDDEAVFVSDETTMLDVSLIEPNELRRRCAEYYKTAVSAEDLRRPLWQLLPDLERRGRGMKGGADPAG